MFVLFFIAFIIKHELIWALTAFMSGLLMLISFNIQIGSYVFNQITGTYAFQLVSYSFPLIMGINLVFFLLSLWLFALDIFDKYGLSTDKPKGKTLI